MQRRHMHMQGAVAPSWHGPTSWPSAAWHAHEVVACVWGQGVLADVSIATGYMTIGMMLAGRFVFQRLGWAAAAYITPAVLLLLGGAFFGLSLSGAPAAARWAVLAGAVTQVRAWPASDPLPRPAHRPVSKCAGGLDIQGM